MTKLQSRSQPATSAG